MADEKTDEEKITDAALDGAHALIRWLDQRRAAPMCPRPNNPFSAALETELYDAYEYGFRLEKLQRNA